MIPWRGGPMHGNDAKLCEPKFSHWDWVSVQRGRELHLGARLPADLDLHFSTAPGLAVPTARHDFLNLDTATIPARALT